MQRWAANLMRHDLPPARRPRRAPGEVQMDDGLWAPGFLEAYRKVQGVW
jgi:hypothetical protein